MASITVPSSSGTSVALSFANPSTASLAANLLAPIDTASAAGTLFVGTGLTPASTVAGETNAYFIAATTTGAVTIPPGYGTVVDAVSGSVMITIVGNNPGQVFVAPDAASTGSGGGFFLTNFSGTVVAGSGTDTLVTFTTASLTTVGDATFTNYLVGGGTIAGGGTDVVSGNTTVTGTGALVFSNGSNATFADIGGADTFVAGTGTTTIDAAAAGGVYYDESGPLDFITSAASSVVAGPYALSVFGGAGISAYFTAGGNLNLVNAANATSFIVALGAGAATAYASAGGIVELSGPSNGNYLFAASGAETLSSAFSTGNNFVFAGTGTDLVYLGNTGSDTFIGGTGAASILGSTTASDVFSFTDGSAGGSNTIFDFNSNDLIALQGYGASAVDTALQKQTVITGGVQITLPDKTTIALAGISHLNAGQVSQS